jgi:hypothetical protein
LGQFWQWRAAGYSALLWVICVLLIPLVWGLGFILWLPFFRIVGMGKDPGGGDANKPGAAMALAFGFPWLYFAYLFFAAVF